MNFSIIPPANLWGKILRAPLKLLPDDLVLPVLQGPLKGTKWIVGSGNHGCWLGSFEYERAKFFCKQIQPGSIVFDIGAHAGYYTLLAARFVGLSGWVFAFEPLPANQEYLNRHLTLNRLDNVTLISAAVAEHSGLAWFEEGGNRYEGRLSSNGKREVRTISLDDEIGIGYLPVPNLIKIDTEGQNLRFCEAQGKPWLFSILACLYRFTALKITNYAMVS